MKAIVFERFGGPDVLEYRDAPDPRPGPDEALVEVKACGINHLDLWVRAGLRGLDIEMPHILGNDVAGIVHEAGAAVKHLKPGDRTLVLPTLSCGVCPACMNGDDNLCRQYDVLGRKRNGGYAEMVAVPAVNCLPYPENLKFTEAAAVPLVFLTAWHMLIGRARLEAGEDCLVMGAGSGVGSAAIQVAKLHGARVIATAGTEAKAAAARKLGADHVVLHSSPEWPAEVRALTENKGVDVVFEHVGGAVFEKAVGTLARNGRLVTCGTTIGSRVTLELNQLFGRHLTLLGSWMGRRAEMVEVLQFVNSGKLRPVVDSVMPLREARKAHERIEARAHFGKIVLVP
jgi:NADPH:quinone reductase-like Zn-dependent oxidoreductase